MNFKVIQGVEKLDPDFFLNCVTTLSLVTDSNTFFGFKKIF